MTKHAHILVVGHACLDSVTVLERSVGADEKLEAIQAWTGGGGPAANAAVALRRLGHRARLWCATGDDAAGRLVREELEKEGIALFEGAAPGSTSLAQVRCIGAERSIAWKRGNVAPLDASSDRVRAALEGIDAVYVDGHEVDAAVAVVDAAAEGGIPCFADLGSLRPGIEACLPHLEWLVTTPRFVRALGPCDTIEAGLETLRRAVAGTAPVGVTLGGRGGWVEHEGRVRPWIARKTGVVDSTGAGDAFHAGLTDGWLQGWPLDRCLEWAATLGAAVCRGPGGRKFLPRDRAQLEKWHGRWGAHPEPDPSQLRARCA